jgi:hypothetical protein
VVGASLLRLHQGHDGLIGNDLVTSNVAMLEHVFKPSEDHGLRVTARVSIIEPSIPFLELDS